MSEPRLKTPGVIAERLGVPLHKVLHILRTRDHIRPTARAGTLRLYSHEAEMAIRHELGRIGTRQRGNQTISRPQGGAA